MAVRTSDVEVTSARLSEAPRKFVLAYGEFEREKFLEIISV